MNYLLDTNVLSELVKPVPNTAVLNWIEEIDEEKFFISVITIGEIRKGITKLPDLKKQKISHWLEIELPKYFEERILNIDIKIADMWGLLQSKNKAVTMPAIDGLIAATAKVHNLILVTRNKKDFINADVEVINPWDML